jgi:hypothetical protein
MFYRSSIAVRALVWLTALLLPVEAMPIFNCGCANGAAPVAQARTCCGKSARRCCCGKSAGGCCCCKGKRSTAGCQCAKNAPAHDQSPSPDNSQNPTAKSLAAAHTDPALDTAVVPADAAPVSHLLSLPGSTSLERLSTLCRLVV